MNIKTFNSDVLNSPPDSYALLHGGDRSASGGSAPDCYW